MNHPAPWITYLAMAVAYVLGSASLLLLAVFLFVGSFHFFELGFSPAAALAWDALLSAAFFFQHSGMVRRSFRGWLERRVPEPLHGLVYTIASGSVLILCLGLWQKVEEPLLRLDGVAEGSLRALFFLAMAGFAWGVRALGSFDTLGVRPAVAFVRGKQPRQRPFVIRGPYRWVRHPLYFLTLVLFWSCPVITLDRLLFNALWTLWVVFATVLEERDLVSQFGESYVRYQRQVPMIIPRIPVSRSSS